MSLLALLMRIVQYRRKSVYNGKWQYKMRSSLLVYEFWVRSEIRRRCWHTYKWHSCDFYHLINFIFVIVRHCRHINGGDKDEHDDDEDDDDSGCDCGCLYEHPRSMSRRQVNKLRCAQAQTTKYSISHVSRSCVTHAATEFRCSHHFWSRWDLSFFSEWKPTNRSHYELILRCGGNDADDGGITNDLKTTTR